jgi:hypothetical protein
MHSLLSHPPLLAHTIYQALAFDASLREDGFALSATLSGRYADDTEWKGISDVILGRKEWFDRWVEGEKACKHRCPMMHTVVSSCALVTSRVGTLLRNPWCQGRVDNY